MVDEKDIPELLRTAHFAILKQDFYAGKSTVCHDAYQP